MKHFVVGNIASRYNTYLKIKELLDASDHLYLVGNTVGLHEGGAEIVLDVAEDNRIELVSPANKNQEKVEILFRRKMSATRLRLEFMGLQYM